MVRDLYVEQSQEDLEQIRRAKDAARANRRAKNRRNAKRYYKPRSEMSPEELAKARRDGNRRSKKYNREQRIRRGLPPVGKPGRPPKQATR